MKKQYSFLVFAVLFLLSIGLIWQGAKQTYLPTLVLYPEHPVSASPIVSNVLGESQSSPSAEIKNLVLVTKVVDGDTIEVLIEGQKRLFV